MGVKMNEEGQQEKKGNIMVNNLEATENKARETHVPGQVDKNTAKQLSTRPIYWPKVVKSPSRRKGHGVRRTRRQENTCFLLSLVDNEEYGDLEVSLTDLVTTQSAFEQLFENQESMEVWNDFMNRSGEEQERYLREMSAESTAENNSAGKNNKDEEDGHNYDNNDKEIFDKRSEHPAHTPDECFLRINPKNRTMLRRRHIPKGSLELHEEELVSWFTDDPTSVFVSMIPNSYERLLLHSVCQYLDLHSISFDCGGQRQTRVENNNDFFEPPPMLLSKYLDSITTS